MKESILLLRAELKHISQNLSYSGEIVFEDFDQVTNVSFIIIDKIFTKNIVDYMKELNCEALTLKSKYLNELTERKKLFNLLQELRGNIRVFCR